MIQVKKVFSLPHQIILVFTAKEVKLSVLIFIFTELFDHNYLIVINLSTTQIYAKLQCK